MGETMVLFVPDDGAPLREARTFASYVGGAESNVATYLAAMGTHVRWGSILGEDPLGQRVWTELSAAGIDMSAVRWSSSSHTGVYLKDPGKSSSTVYYYRNGSAARDLDAEIWRDSRLRDARILHTTGITAAISLGAHAAVRAGVVDGRGGAGHVSFDVNFRPTLWHGRDAGGELAELANAADITFVGMDEAGALWGCRTVDDVRRRVPGAGTLIVKDGAKGAHAIADDSAVFVKSLTVPVVEPVGAGDAFAAGYLRGVLDGRATDSCLRMGHLLAAIALTSRGDWGTPPSTAHIERALALDDDDWSSLSIPLTATEETR